MKSSITGNGTTHIYYNVSITNDDISGQTKPPNIDFNETRTQPFISNPSEYFMSVVRFSLDTTGLPLMAPQPQIGTPTSANALIYSITYSVTIGGTDYDLQQYIIFEPQEQNLLPPSAPLTHADIASPYWYLTSYQWWNGIVNTTLKNLWTAFINAYGPTGLNVLDATQLAAVAPTILWDTGSKTASMSTDATAFDQNPTTGQGNAAIKIYFNSPMYTLYSSFPTESYGWSGNIVNGKNYLLAIRSTSNNVVTDFTTGISTISTFQDYSTIALWNPIQAVVFTTSLLPIIPEMTAAPIEFTGANGFISSGNNANLTNALTDFEVAVGETELYLPQVTYVPQGEYRLVDLFGTNPVSSINIVVYWKDRFGGLVPVTLASGGSANFKLMFRRRDYNNLVVGY
jgi:hypothetical protein